MSIVTLVPFYNSSSDNTSSVHKAMQEALLSLLLKQEETDRAAGRVASALARAEELGTKYKFMDERSYKWEGTWGAGTYHAVAPKRHPLE